ncbi:MAG: heat-inducible transcriptional repressor [Fimbriimonadaceae bacterium]|jgi:heat-inducible transcriptional repressor|nr:heat-inducible transcriptional repressor [Fimbriimonadaceae bacterium]
MPDLDARKQSILHAVIVEYITGAEPVGSELLVQKYALGVKSATVRNELAEMSDLGFLEQPHTSAGRIPSDLGYRYYVDRLIVPRQPELESKQQVKGVAEQGDALRATLRDTARVLSRITHLLTVAATVKNQDVLVRNAVISALGPKQALLVLVLSNGHIENRMLDCPAGLTLEDVGYANEILTATVGGKTLKGITRVKVPTGGSPATEKLIASTFNALKVVARDLTRGILVTEGEEFMLAQPEFQRDTGALKSLLETLSDTDLLQDAIHSRREGVESVTIGRENRLESMHQVSVIRNSFFVGETEAGIIALVGPTRMRYERSIPLVHYTAKALSEALTRFLG